MKEICNAEDRPHAEKGIEALVFYGFPAEHWIHLRTTNPSPGENLCGAGSLVS
jgi:putative transposase